MTGSVRAPVAKVLRDAIHAHYSVSVELVRYSDYEDEVGLCCLYLPGWRPGTEWVGFAWLEHHLVATNSWHARFGSKRAG